MEDREFFAILYVFEGEEITEEYEDFDDARRDFIYFTEEKGVDYAELQKVKIDNGYEDIDIIESY